MNISKTIAEAEADKAKWEAELDRISTKMDKTWMPWNMATLQQDKTAIRTQIDANTNFITKLIETRFTLVPFFSLQHSRSVR